MLARMRIFVHEKARQLRDEGQSFREIGKILNINKCTVAAALDH